MGFRKITLTKAQRQELEEGYQTGQTASYRQRCHGILLKSQDRTSKQIGIILGVSHITVTNWLNRYEKEGIQGLQTKSGRGRQAILDIGKDGELVKSVVQQERQRLKQAKEILEKRLDKRFSTKTLKRFLKSLAVAGNASEKSPKSSLTQNSTQSESKL